jgi:hypothetical protein
VSVLAVIFIIAVLVILLRRFFYGQLKVSLIAEEVRQLEEQSALATQEISKVHQPI